jgi:DNA/RNA endonuclease G (NUC1)
MYNPLLDDDRAVPYVTNPKKIDEFVNIPNCYFKIVTDIDSAEKAIGFRIYTKVIEFYIWNEKGNETLLKAL